SHSAPPHGLITVGTHTRGDRVLIEVEDECGGLPPGKAEDLFRPFEQRGVDKTGLGLGLSISLKGGRANGGEIRVRDLPGRGACSRWIWRERRRRPDPASGLFRHGRSA